MARRDRAGPAPIFALKRRIDVWEQVGTIAARNSYVPTAGGDARSLQQAYDALAAQLRSVTNGDVWERYLLMEEARSRFFGELATDTVEGRNLAKRILMRADYSILSPSQQAFLQQPACAEYLRQLRRVATEPVDYPRLMAELERYEQERSAPAALHLAAAQQVLRWSDDEAVSELGRRLDTNYRNANLRISISRSLMERMLPPPEPVAERVDEIIQGAYTTGCCETLTQLGVRLIPSTSSWRIGLAAKGQVATETQSTSGPAMFHSRGSSVFEAAKEVVIHRYGCYHRAAVADAQTSNELACVSTTLDSVPLVGDLARAIAVDRYRADSQAAEREVQRRVAATASDRIDTEVSDRLERCAKAIRRPLLRAAAETRAQSGSDGHGHDRERPGGPFSSGGPPPVGRPYAAARRSGRQRISPAGPRVGREQSAGATGLGGTPSQRPRTPSPDLGAVLSAAAGAAGRPAGRRVCQVRERDAVASRLPGGPRQPAIGAG